MQTIKFTRFDMATASIRKVIRNGSIETVFAAYLPCGEQDFPEVFASLEAAIRFIERREFVRVKNEPTCKADWYEDSRI